jgi:hypothetical protein
MVFGLSSNLVYGTWLLECSLYQTICDNLSQDLCRLVAHSMDYPPSRRNREKELLLYPFRRILQRADPSAAADGREKEGFILLFGKRPHRSYLLTPSSHQLR